MRRSAIPIVIAILAFALGVLVGRGDLTTRTSQARATALPTRAVAHPTPADVVFMPNTVTRGASSYTVSGPPGARYMLMADYCGVEMEPLTAKASVEGIAVFIWKAPALPATCHVAVVTAMADNGMWTQDDYPL